MSLPLPRVAARPRNDGPRMTVFARWSLLVLLMFQQIFRGGALAGNASVYQNLSQPDDGLAPFDDATCSSPDWIYDDFESKEYIDAVAKVLDTQRGERYKHLSDTRWIKLRKLILQNTAILFIEGSKPTTVDPKYQFEVKFKPGAKPVRANLPRYSPPQAERERHHVLKEQKLGHLRIPESHQLSEWVTKTHIVHKKNDELGR